MHNIHGISVDYFRTYSLTALEEIYLEEGKPNKEAQQKYNKKEYACMVNIDLSRIKLSIEK
jgi:hypothetical protein